MDNTGYYYQDWYDIVTNYPHVINYTWGYSF